MGDSISQMIRHVAGIGEEDKFLFAGVFSSTEQRFFLLPSACFYAGEGRGARINCSGVIASFYKFWIFRVTFGLTTPL
jgi:hypothetical protein